MSRSPRRVNRRTYEMIEKLLTSREFINLATADKSGAPNAAPKFLLKFEKPFIYLIDYSFGRSYDNLRTNPKASLCFMDLDNLEGYRMSGPVELIENGEEFDKLSKEFQRKTLRLTADRVIEGSRTGKRYEHFELEIPDRFVVIKFRNEEWTKIGTRGEFFREREGEEKP